MNTLHYAGHQPLSVTNDVGRMDPGNRSMLLGSVNETRNWLGGTEMGGVSDDDYGCKA